MQFRKWIVLGGFALGLVSPAWAPAWAPVWAPAWADDRGVMSQAPAASAPASVWFGSPAANARRAVMEQAFSRAPTHGFSDRMFAVDSGARTEADADFEVKVLRYIAALGQGAVDRAALGPDWALPPATVDAGALLAQALRTDSLPALLDDLAPVDPQYPRLMAALARYRAIARQGGWNRLEAPAAAYENGLVEAEALRARLAAEGFLVRPDQETSAALRTFQFAHDLDVDGRVGPRTLAALNVPAAARAAQIAANLERWRHLQREVEPRRIVVNIPGARLEVMDGDSAVTRMRVIDGDPDHPTPSFAARISAVTFNPPWNVPSSIARKEILPRLKRRPNYLAEQNIVILNRPDDPFGAAIDWADYSARHFPFQLRQNPGANNALGAVKFEMVDPYDVYLHDTPARGLFARAARALSHGCVRVERAAELAELLLGDRAPADVAQEIDSGATRTINLPKPMPVYIRYLTVTVDQNNEIIFHPDIYGRDGALIDALGLSGKIGPVVQADVSDACG